jgi:hypothetical protein
VALVLGVVDGGEDAVRRVRAVLVGRVHRRVAGVEVDGVDVEPVVEAARVAVAGARSADERDVPAVGGKLRGQGARHVRRAATGKEHQSGEDAHTSVLP